MTVFIRQLTVRASPRSGVVLLLVLVAVVIMLSSLTLWLRSVAAAQRDSSVTIDLQAEIALMHSGERLARDWIVTHGAFAVAPEAGGGWTVARDRVVSGTTDATLSVTVFDGWAGLPVSMIHVRGSLRRELPPIFASIPIPVVPVVDQEALLRAQDFMERVELSPGLRRFPDATIHAGTFLNWATPWAKRSTLPPTRSFPASAGSALALYISPHSDGAININTAPYRLIETVCRLRGIGVPEHLREYRKKGIRSLIPAGADQVNPALPHLVDASLVWNCLITVNWAGRERSWWVVMVGTATNLRMVQRHDASS